MKILFTLCVIALLSGCVPSVREGMLPSQRIVVFGSDENTLGYGVDLSGSIMTASHVAEACKKWNCRIAGKKLDTSLVLRKGDMSIIGNSLSESLYIKQSVKVGDNVYVLRSLSGSFKRYDARVTALDKDYIAYNESLSGTYLTGGVEISLTFEKGESGLPVWTSSGILIGVLSATDVTTGKSYIVQ